MRVGFQIRNVVWASLNWTQPPAARLFSSSSLSSPKPPAAPQSATAGAVADLADDDDLQIIVKPPVTVSKPFVSPDVLQPRVVVYDGVCHLCHTGSLSLSPPPS